MLKLKTVTFFVAHVFLKRLCLPMPSLSIDCRSLLQLLSMISPCIPITFIDYFMKLLYVTFFFLNLFIIQNPDVHLLDALLGPALKLWLDKKIYTVERLIQTCYDVYIIWVSMLS